jgi:hypothetical protein
MEYKEPTGIYPKLHTARDGEVRGILLKDQHIHIDYKKLVTFKRKLNKKAIKEKYGVKSMIEV